MNSATSTLGTLVFRSKAYGIQLRRTFENAFNPTLRNHTLETPASNQIIAESTSLLRSSSSLSELTLQLGKIQNLRVAIQSLNRVSLPAGSTFSFWNHVGRPTLGKGYVEGRELREGCIIASVGGGLCQLSNALYDAALQSGFQIVERHAHSQIIPGSLAESGRDATVFWNYVDLRFAAPIAFQIHARLCAA